MWTQLFYLGFKKAVVRGQKHFGKYRVSPQLNGRYRQLLAKEFKREGLPAFWAESRHHLSSKNKKPREKRRKTLNRNDRIAKITRLMEKADEEILKYRQESINKRRYKGLPLLIQTVAPEWIIASKDSSKIISKDEFIDVDDPDYVTFTKKKSEKQIMRNRTKEFLFGSKKKDVLNDQDEENNQVNEE